MVRVTVWRKRMTQIQKKHEYQEEEEIDLSQIDFELSERQEELDILDKKAEEWVKNKLGEKPE